MLKALTVDTDGDVVDDDDDYDDSQNDEDDIATNDEDTVARKRKRKTKPLTHYARSFLYSPAYAAAQFALIAACIIIFVWDIIETVCFLSKGCDLFDESGGEYVGFFIAAVVITLIYGLDVLCRFLAKRRRFWRDTLNQFDVGIFVACLTLSVITYSAPLSQIVRLVCQSVRYAAQFVRIIVLIARQNGRFRKRAGDTIDIQHNVEPYVPPVAAPVTSETYSDHRSKLSNGRLLPPNGSPSLYAVSLSLPNVGQLLLSSPSFSNEENSKEQFE